VTQEQKNLTPNGITVKCPDKKEILKDFRYGGRERTHNMQKDWEPECHWVSAAPVDVGKCWNKLQEARKRVQHRRDIA
jgi:hypothetical protein